MMETAYPLAGRRWAFWWIRTFLNPLAKVILRSPLHGVMSRRLLLITFTGRTSGKVYTTPISYVQQDRTLLPGVGGPWWKTCAGEFRCRSAYVEKCSPVGLRSGQMRRL